MEESRYEYIYPNTDISIREVQKVELEIVSEFDRICKKYKIPYQIFGGTLLGAVRHKGFIPWDDDVDIAMKRVHYNRFLEICKAELNEKFFLQTCFTDPTSIIQFAKIRKKDTVYENDVDNLSTSNTGIWIDVFPQDNIPKSNFLGAIQRFQIQFYYAMTTSTVKNRVILSRSRWKRITRKFFYYIMRVIPKRRIDRELERIYTRYNSKQTKYVSHLTMGGTKGVYESYKQESNEFDNLMYFDFEGLSLLGPQNYDTVLKNIYGNYMELPPVEKRVPDHGILKVKI